MSLSLSPGPATTRLMKFTESFLGTGSGQTDLGSCRAPQRGSPSAPSGGWKTTTSPTAGFEKEWPMRLTSTRWPICSVGTIDSLGMRYGLTRKAWMPSASPSATATITTSSSREPPADWGFFTAPTSRLGGCGLIARSGGVAGVGRRGVRGLDRSVLLRDALGVHRRLDRGGLGLQLGGRVVQQARLDD